MRRTLGLLVPLALAALLAAGCGGSDKGSPPGAPGVELGPAGSAFYNPPTPLPKGKPGDLIWASSVQAPTGAAAWRVLYLSTLYDGTPVAVSGLVIAPSGKAPAGGRKVLAWAHGTTGGARRCAPSEQPNPAQNLVNYYGYDSPYPIDVGVPALTRFLAAGYVVAATDYQGLGTPGVHQYVIGGTEARNVLDSVKAAQKIEAAHAGNDVVALGWSQGGGAALWVGQDAAYGAPLRVLGSVGLAPAADLGPEAAGKTPPGPISLSSPSHDAALRLNLYRGLKAADPDLNLTDVLTPAGLKALAAYDFECNVHLADVIEESGVSPVALFKPNIPRDWFAKFVENTPGRTETVAPVLVLQGTADTVVNPNGSTQYVQQACRYRQPVQYSRYKNATHQTIPFVGQHEYLSWIADRFAGEPAPSSCKR